MENGQLVGGIHLWGLDYEIIASSHHKGYRIGQVARLSSSDVESNRKLQQLFNNVIHGYSFGFCLKIPYDAVPQDGFGHCPHVLDIRRILGI